MPAYKALTVLSKSVGVKSSAKQGNLMTPQRAAEIQSTNGNANGERAKSDWKLITLSRLAFGLWKSTCTGNTSRCACRYLRSSQERQEWPCRPASTRVEEERKAAEKSTGYRILTRPSQQQGEGLSRNRACSDVPPLRGF